MSVSSKPSSRTWSQLDSTVQDASEPCSKSRPSAVLSNVPFDILCLIASFDSYSDKQQLARLNKSIGRTILKDDIRFRESQLSRVFSQDLITCDLKDLERGILKFTSYGFLMAAARYSRKWGACLSAECKDDRFKSLIPMERDAPIEVVSQTAHLTVCHLIDHIERVCGQVMLFKNKSGGLQVAISGGFLNVQSFVNCDLLLHPSLGPNALDDQKTLDAIKQVFVWFLVRRVYGSLDLSGKLLVGNIVLLKEDWTSIPL